MILDINSYQIKYEIAWSLLNICGESSEETKIVVENGGIFIFLSLMNKSNHEEQELGVWGLANIIGFIFRK